jgi:hypothetical protein
MKSIILARVSTEEQKEAGNSLPAQQARLKGGYIERVVILQNPTVSGRKLEFTMAKPLRTLLELAYCPWAPHVERC